jgi:hypothetical protein
MFPALLLLLVPAADPTPEERAVNWLAREVKGWRPENRCCSCHHNGDGIRALYRAEQAGLKLPPGTLDETTRWLANPAGWADNGGKGPFNDKRQSTLQFANALAIAIETGHQKERGPLLEAARLVVALQTPDGSWTVDNDDGPGSPTVHGRTLATALAVSTLRSADARVHAEAIRKAETWLRTAKVETVYTAAAVLLGLDRADDEAARKQRAVCLELIRTGETKTGGWGPYPRGATEPFDTALVLIALSTQEPTPELTALIQRGRKALLSWQEEDGAWPATTRPAGADSHAQHTSTTAWALWALLRTR